MIDIKNGFLPQTDPLKKLSAAFDAWENTAASLPKLLVSDQFRKHVEQLPEFPIKQLKTAEEYERAMVILSYFGHAYVWGSAQPAEKIPHILAKPWYEVAQYLERPPVLSYASYALHNWYRINPSKPIELGNIALLQNFLGGIDEEWFILVHVAIEAKAVQALRVLLPAQQAVEENNSQKLLECLKEIATAMHIVCDVLDRMPEHCDPYIYYHRVRPYIFGWKDIPALPKGLIYAGMYDNQPQFFRGETGAQSSIIPSLDATLGIKHQNDQLRVYLQEMRDYMPPKDRQFLVQLEKNKDVRDYVVSHYQQLPVLRDIYNECIDLVVRFRMTHLKYAAHYIHKQSQDSSANPTEIGTGGTPFMKYLKKHEDETKLFKI